uniref:Uncharacterized protein n=1 Tax=Anguilla anguilla TaxID=7936 RepID=A0A0E9WX09_ANGAN
MDVHAKKLNSVSCKHIESQGPRNIQSHGHAALSRRTPRTGRRSRPSFPTTDARLGQQAVQQKN